MRRPRPFRGNTAKPRSKTRPSPSGRGYDGDWRRLRMWFLRRNPVCVRCRLLGLVTPATEVDHITPIRDGGERLDQSNLQALCKRCHSRKTRREQMGKGVEG